jgi:Bardet-Biedl syndrome 5 protein
MISNYAGIGLKTISKMNTKKAKSGIRGLSEAFYLLTSQNKTQFEFIFTSRAADSARMFSTLMSVSRAYETSSLYREVAMRAALTSNRDLNLLPQEQLYTKLGGVWNLSSDKGNLGTLFITNVRVVWQCKLNDNYNVSIPYLQMKVVKVRDTKFGIAMVLEAGTMVLGFKVDPYDALKKIVKEIQSLHQVYSSCPIFGVEYSVADEEGEGPAPPTTDVIQEEVELVDTKRDTLAAYLSDPHKTQDREPVFSPELGLAIEGLPEGYSLADLWQIS